MIFIQSDPCHHPQWSRSFRPTLGLSSPVWIIVAVDTWLRETSHDDVILSVCSTAQCDGCLSWLRTGGGGVSLHYYPASSACNHNITPLLTVLQATLPQDLQPPQDVHQVHPPPCPHLWQCQEDKETWRQAVPWGGLQSVPKGESIR